MKREDGAHLTMDDLERMYKAEVAKVAELVEEDEFNTELITRQGDLLRGVVNAVRGEPTPDVLWSVHDAPELVQALVAQVGALMDAVHAKQARIDALMLEYCPGEMTADQRTRWAAGKIG